MVWCRVRISNQKPNTIEKKVNIVDLTAKKNIKKLPLKFFKGTK